VKFTCTRSEAFLTDYQGRDLVTNVELAMKADGTFLAMRATNISNLGARCVSLSPLAKGSALITGSYAIPNVHVEGYCVYTNKTPSSSMRGFGVFPATFACEMQMNKIAHRMKIDPWQLRFTNAYREGDQTPTRRVLDSVYLIETMKACARKAGVELPGSLASMTSAKRREAEA